MSSVFVVAAIAVLRIVAAAAVMAMVCCIPWTPPRLRPVGVMRRRADVFGTFGMGVVHCTRV